MGKANFFLCYSCFCLYMLSPEGFYLFSVINDIIFDITGCEAENIGVLIAIYAAETEFEASLLQANAMVKYKDHDFAYQVVKKYQNSPRRYAASYKGIRVSRETTFGKA